MGMSLPLLSIPMFGLKLECVWNMGMGNGNQESFSILVSNGMESII